MKMGKLVNTNSKGQLVIPQEYRDLLGITDKMILNIVPKATGLFIQPVKGVVPYISTNDVYSQVLERTTGAWRDDDFNKTEKQRRGVELEASKRRKKEW